jgi:RHS repeat-associated protein
VLQRLRRPALVRVAATLMVVATASLSFPYAVFVPAPLSACGVGRALAIYDYDQAGRVNGVWYHWQYLSGGQYVQAPVWANTTDHSHKLGLKVASHFWEVVNGDWSLDRSETYEYDDQTDWLVEVDYNDGLSNEVTTWTYDAAGNRASDSSISGSWTYDNLNRMTASPYGTYTNDLLGNRTGLDTSGDDPRYTWDLLNRMLTHRSDDGLAGGLQTSYTYRADGMRVKKVDTEASPDEATSYYYDGQMGVQDVWTDGTDTVVRKYGVGARGIDLITKKVNSGSESFGYPIYDSHGNMIATLARSGSNSYSTGNVQWYDVWGGVRSGSSSEDQGYVANLGHRKDGESSLTYMRARYYEPSTGRFISQDPATHGLNWFTYAYNSPTNLVDATGKWPADKWEAQATIERIIGFFGGPVLIGLGAMMDPDVGGVTGITIYPVILGLATIVFNLVSHLHGGIKVALDATLLIISGLISYSEKVAAATGKRSTVADKAEWFYFGYGFLLTFMMLLGAATAEW